MLRRPGSGWLAALALALSLVLFEVTDLDLWLQDFFYDRATGRWWVDGNDPLGRALFYNGPKALVWLVALTALALVLGPGRWRTRWRLDRRGLWLAVATIATVPALAGAGKSLTNAFCPSEVRRYGGEMPYAKLCSPYPADDLPTRRGHCFPAGHASGGFALMGLLALRPTRRWRVRALALGLGLGLWMGVYQMLKGAHYLSHTTTTAFLAWLVVVGWRAVLRPGLENGPVGRQSVRP